MPDGPAELATRLEAWLSGLKGVPVSIAALERFHGGAARETYMFEARTAEDRVRMVLRRDPSSSLITTSRAVEFEALRIAHRAGLPVPEPIHLIDDPDVLGAPAFVMEAVEGGRAAGIFEADPYGRARGKLGAALFDTLGRLHAIAPGSWEDSSLPAFDPASRLAFWQDDIERAALRPEPVARAALRWLERHVPPPSGPPALVHGDFRSGNFLVDDKGKLLAVLDWEMAHVGDPMEDLAWAADPLWGHGDRSRAAATVPLKRAIAWWEAASGRRFDRQAWSWWRLFAGVKGLAIWISSAHEVIRHRSVDPVLLFAALYPYRFHNAEVARMLHEVAG